MHRSSTWFVMLLEIFAYILLIGRLLHDSVTQKVLTQQMIGFLTNASDIFELFSLFDEKQIIENSDATVYVLIFWTFSFFQFIPIFGSHNLGETNKKHREENENDQKYYIPLCDCRCGCFEDDDEESTEKYETGFAWVFQDGPFLILRLYLIFKFNLYTQSLIFYALKNVSLTILLIVKYGLYTLVFAVAIIIVQIILWVVFTYYGSFTVTIQL